MKLTIPTIVMNQVGPTPMVLKDTNFVEGVWADGVMTSITWSKQDFTIPSNSLIADGVEAGLINVVGISPKFSNEELAEVHRYISEHLRAKDKLAIVKLSFPNRYFITGTRNDLYHVFDGDIVAEPQICKVFKVLAGTRNFAYNEEASTCKKLRLAVIAPMILDKLLPGYFAEHADGAILMNPCKIKAFCTHFTDPDPKPLHKITSQIVRFAESAQKGQLIFDKQMFHEALKLAGLHDSMANHIDGITCINNFKGLLKRKYECGKAYDFVLDAWGFYATEGDKMRSGKTGLTGQAVVMDQDWLRAVIREKGNWYYAGILRRALEGYSDAYKIILEGKDANNIGDTRKERLQLAFSLPDEKGEYRQPSMSSLLNLQDSRFGTFYWEHIIRIPVGDINLKVCSSSKLAIREEEEFVRTGKRVVYASFPGAGAYGAKMAKILEGWEEEFVGIIRYPHVSPTSLQEVKPETDSDGKVVYNNTASVVYVSPETLRRLGGDCDGDPLGVVRTKVKGLKSVDWAPLTEGNKAKDRFLSEEVRSAMVWNEIVDKNIEDHRQTLLALNLVGKIDLLCRKIITFRVNTGCAMTDLELIDMGAMREQAIQSIKKRGADNKAGEIGEEELDDMIIRLYGLGKNKKFWNKLEVREHNLLTWKSDKTYAGNMRNWLDNLSSTVEINKNIGFNETLNELIGVKRYVNNKDGDNIKLFLLETHKYCKNLIDTGKILTAMNKTLENGVVVTPETKLIEMALWSIFYFAEGKERCRQIKNEKEQRDAYIRLKREIQHVIINNEPEENGVMWQKMGQKEWYYIALAGYMAWIGGKKTAEGKFVPNIFGTIETKNGSVGLDGGVFWYLPETTLMFLARQYAPNSPYNMMKPEKGNHSFLYNVMKDRMKAKQLI